MAKYKVGVIGTGGIAKAVHLPSLNRMPDVEIAALCDIKPDRVAEVAASYNVKKYFTDYRELLNEDLDIVHICTPNYLHSPMAVDALKAGKNVICEKPDAITPQAAKAMEDAAKATGKLLMCIRNNRFRRSSIFLKEFIDAGEMGDIYAAKCGWIRRRGIPGRGGWFTTKAESGGGPLIDLGVHFIDLTMWLMGNPKPVSVVGSTYCKFADEKTTADSVHVIFGDRKEDGTFDVEDMATGYIKFENGASLMIEYSWASNIEKEKNFLDLMGTKAGARMHDDEKQLKIFTTFANRSVDIYPKVEEGGGHATQIRHFINCLEGKEKPIVTPDQGVNMIKILAAIYESAQTGREVRL